MAPVRPTGGKRQGEVSYSHGLYRAQMTRCNTTDNKLPLMTDVSHRSRSFARDKDSSAERATVRQFKGSTVRELGAEVYGLHMMADNYTEHPSVTGQLPHL